MKMRLAILASIACCFLNTYKSDGQPIRNLVFEGAGIRGIAYSGAVVELEKRNLLEQVEKVAGTSAGAIAALTVSLGYSGKEIETIISKMRLQKFNDGRFFFIGGISRMNRYYGWYRGIAFTKWLEEIIEEKTGNSEITFRQLHEGKFKDLYITGTSLTEQKLVIFSNDNFPEMKVKDAVRISMSIPLYFQAVCIDSAGETVNCRKCKTPFSMFVDGGLTGNFPIGIFDSIDTSANIPSHSTIGFRIDTPQQISYDQQQKGLAPQQIHHFKNYVGAFYSYVIENLNRQSLSAEDWARTISISSGTIGPKIRRLSSDEKAFLINNGRMAVESYFEKNRLYKK
jgi:NTE family protein